MRNIPPVNADLIGQPDGVLLLETPALIVDRASFEQNLEIMAKHCEENQCSLRPHAKTHKSVEVAKRQIQAGAVGICCAKIGEAEALAAGGIQDILLTSPVVTERSFERVFRLVEQGIQLQMVVDAFDVVERLSKRAGQRGLAVKVFVDVDTGMHRTGISFSDVENLIRVIENSPQLNFGGLQVYAGNFMHVHSYDQRKVSATNLSIRINELSHKLEVAGIQVTCISGGGTGTFDMDPTFGTFTELQAGSYAFMDDQYQAIEYANNQPAPFQTSLFVATRVISSNSPGLVTTDGGFKAFATDDSPPRLRDFSSDEFEYRFMGDEHGAVVGESASKSFDLGELIFAVTPHCDPTINLYDHIHVINGTTLEDIWEVSARGRSA